MTSTLSRAAILAFSIASAAVANGAPAPRRTLDLVADTNPAKGQAVGGPVQSRHTTIDPEPCANLGDAAICALSVDSVGGEPWRIGADGSFTLLADLEPGSASSEPTEFVRAADHVFFRANGRLAVTDGTPQGTRRVPGPVGQINVAKIVAVGARALVLGTRDEDQQELWSVTAEGDAVALARGPKEPYTKGRLLLLGGGPTRGYFYDCTRRASDSATERACAIKVTRGTLETTETVVLPPTEMKRRSKSDPLVRETVVEFPRGALEVGDVLFVFHEGSSITGDSALFRTDGTPAGTFEITTGGEDATKHLDGPWLAVGDRVVFPADGRTGSWFWSADSNRGSLRRLMPTSSHVPIEMYAMGKLLVSSSGGYSGAGAITVGDGTGTREGTRLLAKGTDDPASRASWMRPVDDDRLLFGTREQNRETLWLVRLSGGEPEPIAMPPGVAASDQRYVFRAGDRVYVSLKAYSGRWTPVLYELRLAEKRLVPVVIWPDAGASGAVREVSSIYASDGSGAFFFARASETEGYSLWHTTRAGTRRVATNAVRGAIPVQFDKPTGGLAGRRLVFKDAAERESQLWVSDGTDAGTGPLVFPKREANAAAPSGTFYPPEQIWLPDSGFEAARGLTWKSPTYSAPEVRANADRLFFRKPQEDGTVAVCWRTAASEEGACLPNVPMPGGYGGVALQMFDWRAAPHALIDEGPRLGETTALHSTVVRFERDFRSATLVGEFVCGAPDREQAPIGVAPPVVVGDVAYVGCDGRLLALRPGMTLAVPVVQNESLRSATLARAGSRLVVLGVDAAGRLEPWVTGGDPASTHRLTGRELMIPREMYGARPVRLASWRDEVFFVASDGTTAPVLWRTDGTPEGTVPVAFDGWREPVVDVSDLMIAGSDLYFTGFSRSTGREVWRLRLDGH